jgi:aldehyde:ferredoxin oxidoreductase
MASHRIAHIDLGRRRVEIEDLDPGLIRTWAGGSGLASWRLYQEVGPETDPLGPGNVVYITGGPLTGTVAPCSGRVEVVTKSALTGLLGLSNSGGMFGARLRQGGLDGLVLRGVSEEPVYLLVRQDQVEFRDARRLWGRDTWETAESIGRELNDPSLQRVKVMAIGPAGENLVRFACLINEHYHAAGRGGAGAVLGAKKVKAIAVDSKGSSLPVSSAFRDAASRAAEKIRKNTACQNYSRFGALPGSDTSAEIGCLPGKNYQTGVLEGWHETRGTAKAKSYVARPRGSCFRCAMPCFNEVEVPGADGEGFKITSGTFVQVIFDFGAKCGVDSLPGIWRAKEMCHRLGMDQGAASGSASFAMELFQRGILTLKDTRGLAMTWGDEKALLRLLDEIAHRRGLGKVLGEGTLRASKVIGGDSSRYVMTIKGMEMMSSDPRSAPRAWALGALTSPRGGDNVRTTHMKGETISSLSLLKPERRSDWEQFSREFVASLDMFPETKTAIYGDPPLVDPFTYSGKALMTKWFEDLFALVNALGLCTFPADKLALGPGDYAEMFSGLLGETILPEDFMKIGERIFNIQRLFAVREGVGRKDDTWPSRFFEEKLPEGPAKGAVVSKETIDQVLDEYYDARGWDRATGHPPPATLSRLGLPGPG